MMALLEPFEAEARMSGEELADTAQLPAGWYIELLGEKVDLDDWVYTLNEPFDPVAFEEPDGGVLLKSREFAQAETAEEVREKASALIARMNGAMALMHSARPIANGAVIRVDDHGKRHSTVFAQMAAFELGRCVMRATAVVLGPDGQPLPPPPPQPSAAQQWNALAGMDDDCADLLEQLGKADGWYEIYKTIEIAEGIVGGKHKLERMLGTSREQCVNMRATANYYRHARTYRPPTLTTLAEAKPLLHFMVRAVLDKKRCEAEALGSAA